MSIRRVIVTAVVTLLILLLVAIVLVGSLGYCVVKNIHPKTVTCMTRTLRTCLFL